MAMTTGDVPRDMTPTVTRPTGKLYPLNSSRLVTDVIKKIAVQLGVPGTASRADTQPMVEAKIEEQGHEPRNVQVRISEREDSTQLIELMDAEGAFLQVEVPAEEPEGDPEGGSRPGAETGDETEEGEALRTQLEEARAQNENLESQVCQLRAQLDRAKARISELWRQQCAQVSDFDRQLGELEAEVESLRAGSHLSMSTPREPETRVHIDSSTVHASSSTSKRRGKALPVEPFSGEMEAVRLDDWLPALERAATWNDWTEEDRLLQLAGHLRGRAVETSTFLCSKITSPNGRWCMQSPTRRLRESLIFW